MQVTVSQLVSLTKYYVYCGVRNFLHLTSTTSELHNTMMQSTTACCKRVIVTSSPSFVLNNGSLYISGQTTGNIVSFRLDAVPLSALTITLKLTSTATGLTVNDTKSYQLRPNSFAFSSDSRSTTGSFAVLLYNVTGTYTITLVLGGTSATEYYTTSLNIRAADSANVPLPSLKQVIFGDNGGSLYFIFAARTNYAQLGGVWPCKSLFAFAGANRTSCYWINSTVVLGTFPTKNTGSLLEVGGNVTLLGNKIRASCVGVTGYCPLEKASSQSVTAVTALHPISPTIVLPTPGQIPACENITIDPTATTGIIFSFINSF